MVYNVSLFLINDICTKNKNKNAADEHAYDIVLHYIKVISFWYQFCIKHDMTI